MKKVFILLFILNFVVPVFAGNFAQELNNSIARAKSGSIVQYTLHFPDGKAQLFTGADFTSGRDKR